jgi:hypothetical protein
VDSAVVETRLAGVASPRPRTQATSPAPGRIHAVSVDSTLTLLVQGWLDAAVGAELVSAVRAGMAPGIDRLDIDLRDVTGYTPQGAQALALIRDLSYALVDGVHYRTVGVGGDALLAAFASPDAD